ncbi:hypothetical protein JW777_02785 [bacterium]|nr:hypothetical protein [bacterium]
MFSEAEIEDALVRCWSADTASTWTHTNPAAGQCSVTALALRDAFGGRLLKTRIRGGWHFYNEICGVIYDFTASQFPSPVAYDHEPASTEEALADTSPEQLRTLAEGLARELPSSRQT